MATAAEQFGGEYITVADLNDKPRIITIDHVEKFEILNKRAGKKECKPKLFIVGTDRVLLLNKTNWKSIAKVTGQPDDEDWNGYKIKLVPAETDYDGERVACIRVDGKFVERPGKRRSDEEEEQPKGKKASRDDGDDNPFNESAKSPAKARRASDDSDDDDDMPF